MASGEGNGVDHAFNKTFLQDDPSSQRELTGATPTPVLAFAPEINREDPQANFGSGPLAHRQDDSARTREPKAAV
jgi:hypothetical protein